MKLIITTALLLTSFVALSQESEVLTYKEKKIKLVPIEGKCGFKMLAPEGTPEPIANDVIMYTSHFNLSPGVYLAVYANVNHIGKDFASRAEKEARFLDTRGIDKKEVLPDGSIYCEVSGGGQCWLYIARPNGKSFVSATIGYDCSDKDAFAAATQLLKTFQATTK